MDRMDAVRRRHAVRDYMEKPIDLETLAALQEEIDRCNAESGLHIQLVCNEPDAFGGLMARYGKFRNVRNYIALIGGASRDLEEQIGYYGERIVLTAQQLGLNTCWVAMTFRKRKSKCAIARGERFVCALSLGYGRTQGVPHKSKPMRELLEGEGAVEDWVLAGMESAMLAPTAMNQQNFIVSVKDHEVKIRATGGFYSRIDLGIVKYHFEIGAGKENFTWVN